MHNKSRKDKKEIIIKIKKLEFVKNAVELASLKKIGALFVLKRKRRDKCTRVSCQDLMLYLKQKVDEKN